jgi:hypothetical protein
MEAEMDRIDRFQVWSVPSGEKAKSLFSIKNYSNSSSII